MIGVTSGTAVTFRMNPEQWASFQKLQRIQPDVLAMLNSGVFDFKSGRAVIHRDHEGKLRKIEIEVTKYIT